MSSTSGGPTHGRRARWGRVCSPTSRGSLCSAESARSEGRGPVLNTRQTNNSNPQAERRPSVATEPARWFDVFRSSDDKSNTRGLHVPSRITQGARVSRANGRSCFSAREKSKETPATKDAPWRATDDDFDRAPSGRMNRTPTTHPAMCSRTVPRGTLVIRPLASLESSSVSRLVARDVGDGAVFRE